ncbi:Hypothetical predicted protein [Pelobates cultripes]|uniref:Uncharacterized protein n=1 Tax=Pelobates cultripes TaxID=61616 RepID=A0AAD1W0C9_PELCU|nr:Hypothetical predicted protein [Pelobates cultripes]
MAAGILMTIFPMRCHNSTIDANHVTRVLHFPTCRRSRDASQTHPLLRACRLPTGRLHNYISHAAKPLTTSGPSMTMLAPVT